MSKQKYSVDLISSQSKYLGKYDIDLSIISVGNTDFTSQVVVYDPSYQSVAFARNFPTFKQARTFFALCLDNESSILEINDLYQLARDFYDGKFSSGGDN